MKKQVINKIGFKFTWEAQVEPIETLPIQNINTEEVLSPSVAQLKERMEATKHFMTTTQFARMKKADKEQILNDLAWYISLSTEIEKGIN